MSTTTNIGLFKHDNPATNTDEFNVDKALNENWDKLDTEIGIDRERITTLETDNTTNKQDISELEAENARLKEDLNGLPKGQVLGETIDLTDSAEMRCDLKIRGNSKQETREGDNRLDLSNLVSKTQNGVTATKNKDGSITFNGTATAGFTIYKTTINLTLHAGTYKNSIKTPIIKGIYISLDNTAETMIKQDSTIESTYKEFTLTEETTFTNYLIWIDNGTTFNNFTIYPMVYSGTEIKDYEQYGASPSPDYPSEVESCGDNGNINEVICNKNLLPINVTEKTMYGITITKKSDGTYSLNGTATTSFTFDLYSGDYIKLPSGTYTGQSGQMLGFYIRKDSGDYQTLSETNKKTNTFTITEDFIYNRIYMYIFSGKTYNNTILTPMLEEGSIATEFEEYKSQTYTIPTQQPMRSVGDIRDEFVKVDDKWFERHYIARKIFDGTENFVLSGSLKNTNRFSTNNYKSTFKNAMSSHFKYAYDYNLDEPHFYLNSSSLFLFVNNTISTVAELQAYLAEQYNAGTPVYVDYILETPLDIECTEEQNTILDKIEKEAKTYKNITHIYSTDEISPNVDVTYKKDIDTMITNIEQAILSQGGNI